MKQNEPNFNDENERLEKLIEIIAKDIQRYCGKNLLFDDARYFMAIVYGAQSLTKDQLALSEEKSGLFILGIDQVNRSMIEKIYFCNLTYMLAFHFIEIPEGDWENLEDSFIDITQIDIDKTRAFRLNRGEEKFNIAENAKQLAMDLDIISNNINGVLLPGFDFANSLEKGIKGRSAFLKNNPESYTIYTI